ncbi:hypothetical protein SGLAM104S_08813 [Streptomyces glaucescens]
MRDRRVAHVRLTDAGRELVDGLLPDQLAYESAVLSGLGAAEQGELAGLLGDLLTQLEGRLGGLRSSAPPGVRLRARRGRCAGRWSGARRSPSTGRRRWSG